MDLLPSNMELNQSDKTINRDSVETQKPIGEQSSLQEAKIELSQSFNCTHEKCGDEVVQ
jgi:hypothetical protein